MEGEPRQPEIVVDESCSKKQKTNYGKVNKKRSMVWDHFTNVDVEVGGRARATCNYCGTQYAADTTANGTSTMKSHLVNQCAVYPYSQKNINKDKKQTTLGFEPSKDKLDTIGKLTVSNFSVDACRKALAEMIILDELPSKFVEGQGFKWFMYVVQPKWTKIPCRITVAKDCMQLYEDEKNNLKKAFKGQRVCLTTDTWTLLQNLNYMCLTAHFIDNDWKLHKKILNFCLVLNHKGETLGKVVEQCLFARGIDKILTVTVDNASSNNGLITFLKLKRKDKKNTILEHEFLHVRWCTHILNLIVSEGLKDINVSIKRVRNIVKYVRSSPSRFAKFRSCVEIEGIESKLVPCLDVATRWNSTYFMLERSLVYQIAFDRMEDEDGYKIRVNIREDELGYVHDASSCEPVCPNTNDWDIVKLYVKVLKLFYDTTLQFSGSLYVTSNAFFGDMVAIKNEIASLEQGNGLVMALAIGMRKKFDKYWGNFEKINSLLLFAVVLDPRYKIRYVEFCFEQSHTKIEIEGMMKVIMEDMTRMYEWYEKNNTQAMQIQVVDKLFRKTNVDKEDGINAREAMKMKFKRQLVEETNMVSKSELERYLMEGCESDVDTFDVLGWWRINSSRYNILSQVARDILAIPVSTVASESAFSTGGHILDPYQISLSPKVAEALICTQNWLRHPTQISIRSLLDEVEQLESVLMEEMKEDSVVIDL